MERLMDCPFCGSNDIGMKEVSNNDNGKIYAVMCKKCNSTVFGDISKSESVARSYAKNRWNLRTYKVPIKEIVKEVPSKTSNVKEEVEEKIKAQPQVDSCWVKYDSNDKTTWPESDVKLLLVGTTGAVFIGFFNYKNGTPHFFRSKNDQRKALYWMHIPEAPEV